jgi:hypothetical protein
MARRASLHSAPTASVAAKDFLNSPRVERRNLATAIANRSVMAAYTVMSRIFSAQTIPYEDNPEAKETAALPSAPPSPASGLQPQQVNLVVNLVKVNLVRREILVTRPTVMGSNQDLSP